MIFLDSWVWIEFFLKGKKKDKCLKLMSGEEIVIDPLVLMEIKYKTSKLFGSKISDDIILAIESMKNVRILPLLPRTAKLAADLRLKYYSPSSQLSYADCVHLATAIHASCRAFYSGDDDFMDVKELDIIIV